MYLSALCVTRGRPDLVREAVRQFELQTHREAELIIIDDAGQYGRYCGPANVRVLSRREEVASLATLRNRGFELAAGHAVAIWDDDDWYFPWHLSALSLQLDASAKWVRPLTVWDEVEPGQFYKTRTAGASGEQRSVCYHGCWAITREAWELAGRYPTTHPGDSDSELSYKILATVGPSADSVCDAFPEPSYCYRRHRCAVRGSEMSAAAMLERRKETLTYFGDISGAWPDRWMEGLPAGMPPGPRRW